MKKNRYNRTQRRSTIMSALRSLPRPLPLPLAVRRRNATRRVTPTVYAVRSLTAGGLHAWLTTDVGRIRKPNGAFAIRPGMIQLTGR